MENINRKTNTSLVISILSLIVSCFMIFTSFLLRDEARESIRILQYELNISHANSNINKVSCAVWNTESIKSFKKTIEHRIKAKVILSNYSNVTSPLYIIIESNGFCVYKDSIVNNRCDNKLVLETFVIRPNTNYNTDFYIHVRSDKPKNVFIMVKTFDYANNLLLHEKIFSYELKSGKYEFAETTYNRLQ